MEAKLIKIDKNGTKYYEEEVRCSKCNGTGHIDYFNHIYGGECFDCNGTGHYTHRWKEYTPEYKAKLDAKAKAKRDKEIAELKATADGINQKFFEKNGFDENGDCYVVLGDTYDIKDELKAKGAKWHGHIQHWVLNNADSAYNTLKLNASEIYYKDFADRYFWNQWRNDINDTRKKIADAEEALVRANSSSDFVGNIGDKLQIEVDHHELAGAYETQFGTICIYKFYDKDGNIFVWKTSAYVPEIVATIKGTVKEHSEYRGEKQTILTRCKIA